MNRFSRVYRVAVIGLSALLVAGLLFSVQPAGTTRASDQFDLIGPAGSGRFGQNVTVLPNGNIVVADPAYDAGAVVDVGAVYLYSGASGALISTLTGSAAGDKVGDQPVVVLSDGNYLVSSSEWANGGAAKAGAVTWCSALTGCAGPVSPANSLVGSSADDQVGFSWLTYPSLIVLNDGNYVVTSISWTNGTAAGAGAVTWCAAGGGCTGPVSTANSLVGSTSQDVVGLWVTVLTSGDYVVTSPTWANGPLECVGAVTLCSGTGNCNGQAVSAANSLVGSQALDLVGGGTRLALSNGSYVVSSPSWDGEGGAAAWEVGAVTWCSGAGECVGPVTTANSLVGSSEYDQIGFYLALQALDNGNSYVVRSSYWNNGAVSDAGAVTWCSDAGSCNGKVVGADNSLVGTVTNEAVGMDEIIPLANGNFLVFDSKWGSSRGALAWCSGTVGCSGEISEANSVVDPVTLGSADLPVTLLSNGNYVVANRTDDEFEVMWCDGTVGCHGATTAATSLTGDHTDVFYVNGITPLENGNYVVAASYWGYGVITNAGAVTMCGGNGECNGQVMSAANSLMGSSANDSIGAKIVALKGGGYAVVSPNWNNGAVLTVGAVTLCDGLGGCNGETVTAANSLVGATAGDQIGKTPFGTYPVEALADGGYVVGGPTWQDGAVQMGSVTVCSAAGSCTGQVVSAANSLVGSAYRDLYETSFTKLANGSVVVAARYWNNGAVTDAGAVTLCGGTGNCEGAVSAANSLIGNQADDYVGAYSVMENGVIALENGSYVVISTYWDNGAAADAGAVTWCSASGACTGDVASANSVLGLAAGGGESLNATYDGHYNQLVVGRPADNRVTLLKPRYDHQVYVPLLRR